MKKRSLSFLVLMTMGLALLLGGCGHFGHHHGQGGHHDCPHKCDCPMKKQG